MELRGETLIAAPRTRVWSALNDPEMLARCIDGIETLTRIGDDRFEGKMHAKVGPVRATFTGMVTLTDIDPPSGYTISGEGKGGAAGFAKGSAEIRLADEAMADGSTGTRLAYVARSTVGGKLAQLGARLIEGTARSYAENFFAKLKAELEAPSRVPESIEVEPVASETNIGIGSDTGEAVAAMAAAELEPTMAPTGPLPPAEAPTARGLSPFVWGALLTLVTFLILLFLLSR